MRTTYDDESREIERLPVTSSAIRVPTTTAHHRPACCCSKCRRCPRTKQKISLLDPIGWLFSSHAPSAFTISHIR